VLIPYLIVYWQILVLKGRSRRGAAKRWQQRLEFGGCQRVQRHIFAENRGCPKIAMFMQTRINPHTHRKIYIYVHYTPLGWLDPHIIRSTWNIKSSSSSSIVSQHQPSLTNWPCWPLSLSCWILNHDHHEAPLLTPSPGGSFNSSSPVSPFFVGDPLGSCKLFFFNKHRDGDC
jgi:hypothetical protein